MAQDNGQPSNKPNAPPVGETAEQRLAAERDKLEAVFYGADFPMVLFRGPDLVYEMANEKYLELIAFRDVIGKKLLDALPEISDSDFPRLIKRVHDTGESVQFPEGHTPILSSTTGKLEDRYFDTTFARISDGPDRGFLVIGSAMDVTARVVARKLLESANRQTELEAIRADRERAKFEAAFHAVAEGIFIFDSNGNPVFMNDGAAKVFGAKTAAEVTKNFEYFFERLDLYDLEDNFIPLTEWPVARALRGESFREWPIKAHRRDTGDKWIWSSSGELAIQPGTDVTLAVVVLRDITEQKRAENELKAAKSEADLSREKLYASFMQTPAPLVVLSGPEHTYTLANPPYEEMVGRSVLGKKVLEAFSQSEVGDFVEMLDNVYRTGKTYSGKEMPLVLPDAEGHVSHRFLDVTYNALREPDGTISGIIALHQDVTDQVSARKLIEISKLAIENERENFRNLFEQTPEMVCIMSGPNHVFEFVNEAHIKVLGFDATGKSVREAQPESKEVHGILDDVYRTGKTAELHEIPVTVGGKLRYFNLTYAARRDANGKTNGVMILGVEITTEIQNREELRQAKEEAERANSLKSAFLANMSHEIRTPLGAMIGFADLLKDPGLSNNEKSVYLDVLARNGEQLSVLINDILDLSKVEAGQLTMEYLDVQPEQIVAEVISLLKVKAREKDLALELEMASTTPPAMVSDPTRVRQVLINLIGNSIKFTQTGSVKVKCYRCKNSRGNDSVCFEISDTGIGIPPEQLDNIFEVFVQADGSMSRKFGGTGLGLSLSRRLAKSLGGDVWIQSSEPGKGSTFVFQVEDQPAKRQTEPAAGTLQDIELKELALKGLSVLVVDDAADNQQLICRYLTKQGAAVDTAENGLVGYRKALMGDFDIVLMDIQMPEMDGYTATQKLRRSGYHKPILALTAHAMSDVRKRCLNVGCTDHLSKPINPKELVTAIVRYAR